MINKSERIRIKEQLLKFSTSIINFSCDLPSDRDYTEFRRRLVKYGCSIGAIFWQLDEDPNLEEIGKVARKCLSKAIRVAFILDLINEMELADPTELRGFEMKLEPLIEEFEKYKSL